MSLRLPKWQHDALKLCADKSETSVNSILQGLVSEYLTDAGINDENIDEAKKVFNGDE